MLFNSPQFWIFFGFVALAYLGAPRHRRSAVLLIASLVFYAMWLPLYLLLLLADVGVNYLILRRLLRSRRPRAWLALSVALSLGVLAWFKYAGFFATAATALLAPLGSGAIPVPDLVLPLGISFYTFQMIALQVDCYRGGVSRIESFREYLLFLAFFPQLIAGPILRGNELLPQLRACPRPTASQVRRGLWLVTSGCLKKVVLADALLAPYVDRVFAHPGFSSAPEHLIAVYSFAFQIYFDFSGYTDIARGTALWLGIELPLNFREPYLSRNPAEFWRRWHITLSQWLRDYLYIPLGGNRRGRSRTYANLVLTMLLGGLWHGAGWTFVIWGGIHGVILAIHRALTSGRALDPPFRWRRDLAKAFVCFHLVCLAWVFFRAPDLLGAVAILGRLLLGPYDRTWPAFQLGVVVVCALLHPLERLMREQRAALDRHLDGFGGRLVEGAVLGAVLGLALLLGGIGGEFIYFQF